MTLHEAEGLLGQAIRETPEYQDYIRARDAVNQDPVSSQLIQEYNRLQNRLQMFALTGRQTDEQDTERFRQLGGLLFAAPATSAYLLSQLRIQKLLADIFAQVSEAAGVSIQLPDLS